MRFCRFLYVYVAGVAVGCLLGGGCATTSQKRRERPETPDRAAPETPDHPEVRRSFERALEALERGEYERAAETFRRLRAEHRSSAIGRRASLYAARASMGSLPAPGSKPSRGEHGVSDRVVSTLRKLAGDSRIESDIRRAADVYLGLAHYYRDRTERADEVFGRLSEARMPAAVLVRDRPRAFTLLIGARRRAGDRVGALRVCRQLYDGAAELAASTSGSTEKALRAFAEVQAFRTLRRDVSLERLRSLSNEESTFVRAVAGTVFVERALERGGLSEERRREVAGIAERARDDLASIGADDRARSLAERVEGLTGSKRLVLAAVLPLSGHNQGVGRQALDGMLLGLRALRYRGRPRVTLVFVDSSSPPKEVVPRLVDREVSAVIGPLSTSAANRYARALADTKLPMVPLTSRPIAASTNGGQIFRNFLDPGAESRAVAALSAERWGDRRAVVLRPDNGYGAFAASNFTRAFRRRGGEVLASVTYQRDKSNYSAVAERVAGLQPDAVFIPDAAPKIAELSAFLADQGVWSAEGEGCSNRSSSICVHYLGTSLWRDSMLTEQAGSYVDGAAVPAWFAPEAKESMAARFARRFRASFDRAPGQTEAFAFDSVRWLRELLLERGVGSPTRLRRALASERRFEGATGVASFRADGTVVRSLRFLAPRPSGFELHPFTLEVHVRSVESSGDGRSTDAAD
ncbi:MAG: ABC transporter substrate-binding protein [Bradymonadaceae bacterium]